MKLEVLTYNIHKGFCTGNWRFVLDEIREQIKASNADLVFLQEIYGNRSPHKKRKIDLPEEPHFEYLAEQIWPHFIYGKNAIYRRGDHGNAILSKYPFCEWENISLTRNPRASRSILHGVIELEGNTRLHTLCVHMGLLQREREQHVKKLVERIRQHVPDNEPMIIAGDFNDWRSRINGDLEQDLGARELFHFLRGRYQKTFPIWKPMLPVDRIYYRGLEAITCETHADGHWLDLSDHVALGGSFELVKSV